MDNNTVLVLMFLATLFFIGMSGFVAWATGIKTIKGLIATQVFMIIAAFVMFLIERGIGSL